MATEKCKIECREMDDITKKVELMEKDMVHRSIVWKVIGVTVILFGVFTTIGWNSVIKARDERTMNASNIKVFNVKQDMLLQTTQEIKVVQEKVRMDFEGYKRELKADREKFQETILKAIQGLRKP